MHPTLPTPTADTAEALLSLFASEFPEGSTPSLLPRHDDQFRALHEESKIVYGIAGGVAQSMEHRPRGPQGVETNE